MSVEPEEFEGLMYVDGAGKEVRTSQITVDTPGTPVSLEIYDPTLARWWNPRIFTVTVKALKSNTGKIYVRLLWKKEDPPYILNPGETVTIESKILYLEWITIDADNKDEGVCLVCILPQTYEAGLRV